MNKYPQLEINQTLLGLLTSCEALFVLINRDPKSPHVKKFLNEIKESTDNLLESSENFTYKSFIKAKRRPYLFELIRYTKEEILEKNLSKRFIEELSISLEELGFSYGVPFTKDDIVKLTVLASNYKENIPLNLSLTEEEIKRKKI